MIEIIEVKKDEEYQFGDIPDKLYSNLEKHGAPDTFKSIDEAIKCLRKNGNKEDIELITNDYGVKVSDFVRVYDYKGELKDNKHRKKYIESADDLINSITKTSTKQYFEYQEELNQLTVKMDEIKTLRDNLKDGLKTEITTVLLAYDYNDSAKITLTKTGLKIELPLKVYNDYEIIHKIDTQLFTKLNELIGVAGKLNIQGAHKQAGNIVYTLELIYEL